MSAKKKVTAISTVPAEETGSSIAAPGLLGEVRDLIRSTREELARTVNAGLTLLHWEIGNRIRRDVLQQKRAEYGKQIVAAMARQLEAEFGIGFGARNLFYMVQFAEAFPDQEILHALRSQLGWTHFRSILRIEDSLKQDFYAEMCRMEKWNTRTLDRKIDSMLYERTALSKKPEALIRQELKALRAEDRMTPDLVFRDPYLLDFLGLKNTYAEKDVEAAILREMESFILEMGNGFAFVARQKRMIIDDEDHHLDLHCMRRWCGPGLWQVRVQYQKEQGSRKWMRCLRPVLTEPLDRPANRDSSSLSLKDLPGWLKRTDTHPLISSCVFHYELKFIHPFTDGNGRMGRLWQTLILSQWQPVLAWLPVESVIRERQSEYYRALADSDRQGSSTVFIGFLLSTLLQALRETGTSDQVGDQVSDQVKTLLRCMDHDTLSAIECMQKLGLAHRPTFRKNYLDPALAAGLIVRTRPDSPNSRLQKYQRPNL